MIVTDIIDMAVGSGIGHGSLSDVFTQHLAERYQLLRRGCFPPPTTEKV